MSNRWSGARPSFDTPQAHGIVDFRRLPSESYPAPSADQAVGLCFRAKRLSRRDAAVRRHATSDSIAP